MAGSAAGAEKTAAKRLGLPIEEYAARLDAGEQWCTTCKQWLLRDQFRPDASRGRDLSASCRACSNVRRRASYRPVVDRKRMGPPPAAQRDGDKKQARGRINTLVKRGALPRPDLISCADCGRLGDDKRHEYDHFRGYGVGHHEDVEAVCTTCHGVRESARLTHCRKGHELVPENVRVRLNGSRLCLMCDRARDKKRSRPPGYWKQVNDARREYLKSRRSNHG